MVLAYSYVRRRLNEEEAHHRAPAVPLTITGIDKTGGFIFSVSTMSFQVCIQFVCQHILVTPLEN
jgi:hypothetical protein